MSFNGNKYGSRKKKNKPTFDGYEFDSDPERDRYLVLKSLLRDGLIRDLEVHPVFILSKLKRNEHGQTIRQWKYTADFKYFDCRCVALCVDDVKSLRIDKKGKKHGTSQSRDYKLTRNEFMRQNPHIFFREIT